MEQPLPIPKPINKPIICTAPTIPAAIDLRKEVLTTGPYTVGNDIIYQLTVTNTGGTNLKDAVITDSLSSISVLEDPLGLMSPGGACIDAKWTTEIFYSYKVVETDIDVGEITNTACLSSPLLEVCDEASVNDLVTPPGLELSQTYTLPSVINAGSIVNYQTVINNPGESDLLVKLTESLPELENQNSAAASLLTEFTTIPAGESFTATYDYIITSIDLQNNKIENTVCAIPAVTMTTLTTVCVNTEITL